MENFINIVCATDNNFAQNTAVMLCSVFENLKKDKKLFIYILLTEKLNEKNIKNIIQIVESHHSKIEFVYFKKNNNLPEIKHLTFNTYLRLFFADKYKNIDKFIYLDSDIVVEGDVFELWCMKFKKNVLFAVKDLFAENYYSWFGFKKNNFFNAGVMFIDAKKFRKFKILNKSITFLSDKNKNIFCGDQDALNYFLPELWGELDLSWNVTSYFFKINYKNEIIDEKIKRALKKPNIIHFSPGKKPTDYLCDNIFYSRYYYYLKLTPYSNFIPKNKNLFNMIIKKIKMFIPLELKRLLYKFIKYF